MQELELLVGVGGDNRVCVVFLIGAYNTLVGYTQKIATLDYQHTLILHTIP